jgi:hypothetical protein
MDWIYAALHCTLTVLCAVQVYLDCKRIGETAWYNVSGTIILWPHYYIFWILWWPGSLRRQFPGASIDDLPTAKAFQRLKLKHEQSPETESNFS